MVSAVSGSLALTQGVVFAASGLMLFAMAKDLGLSATAMGTAYMLIVLGACIGAPMPVFAMRGIGGRWTVVAGQVLLGATFAGLAFAHTVGAVYAGAVAMGIAFSLSGNTPGVYLVSGWAGARAPGLIGIYMMVAMLGNAVGPPATQGLIALSGWHGYALAIAGVSVLSAILCALALREPPAAPDAPLGRGWRELGAVLRSRTFVVLAVAIVTSQICMVTVASVAPAHLAAEHLSDAFAARLLAIEGVVSALATGLFGHFAKALPPRRALPLTLIACGVALLLLAWARDTTSLTLFAVLLGAGVGGATLAVTLLLVEYFGPADGAATLGAVWTLAGLAAVGPWIGGLVADAAGSYAPALAGIGLVMLPVAVACLLLPRVPDPA